MGEPDLEDEEKFLFAASSKWTGLCPGWFVSVVRRDLQLDTFEPGEVRSIVPGDMRTVRGWKPELGSIGSPRTNWPEPLDPTVDLTFGVCERDGVNSRICPRGAGGDSGHPVANVNPGYRGEPTLLLLQLNEGGPQQSPVKPERGWASRLEGFPDIWRWNRFSSPQLAEHVRGLNQLFVG